MDESYRPLLKILGQRSDSGSEITLLVLILVVAVPLLLLGAYVLRGRLKRRKNRLLNYERLQKTAGEKGLDYVEQATAERMAEAAGLQNPAQILTSIDSFDHAAAAWVDKLRKAPWAQTEEQLERLSALRETLGFRYLSPDRPPRTTRQLPLNARLYILASGRATHHLFSAPVLGLDDLAICTGPFEENERPLNLHKNQETWVFFWSETGAEYRFKTRVFKQSEHPVPHLLLQHGDALVYADERKIFSCTLDQELTAGWLPAARTGSNRPSPRRFEENQGIEPLRVRILELSGSGFVLSADADFRMYDLVRFEENTPELDFLEGKIGRAVKITDSEARFKFVDLSHQERHAILHCVAPRISLENLHPGKHPSKPAPLHKT